MRQIIAFGGGGLSLENPLNDLYLLAQSPAQNPNVCLIPTASGDNFGVIRSFYQVFSRYPCKLNFLPIFQPSVSDFTDFLCHQDIIFVSGGNSKCMLDIWKGYGVDKALKTAYENGVILSGGSAGAVCWFKECLTDSFHDKLSVMPALGFLPYSNCPHYSLKARRQAYRGAIRNQEILAGYAVTDHCGLHFIDEKLHRAVADIPNSFAHWVEWKNDELIHEKLDVKNLADRDVQQDLLYSFSYGQDEEETITVEVEVEKEPEPPPAKIDEPEQATETN
jgi:dipeptidase E